MNLICHDRLTRAVLGVRTKHARRVRLQLRCSLIVPAIGGPFVAALERALDWIVSAARRQGVAGFVVESYRIERIERANGRSNDRDD
ncbi:MAG: hypothetical protein JW809_16530 [Pirellulales bacterium]|nr:hypothetical protein [Pirellulales bacterium]